MMLMNDTSQFNVELICFYIALILVAIAFTATMWWTDYPKHHIILLVIGILTFVMSLMTFGNSISHVFVVIGFVVLPATIILHHRWLSQDYGDTG
jgi:hypothetical protein